MSAKQARFYQTETVNLVEQAIITEGKRRILVVLPTGAGKTLTSRLILSSEILKSYLGVSNRKIRVLFLANNNRLLHQAAEEYAGDDNIEIILQSTFSDIPESVIEAGWDITVLDEAHHEAMASIQYRLETITTAPVIGLTATPVRADGLMLKFDKILAPLSRTQAVDLGYLAKTYLNTVVDVGGADKTAILTEVFKEFRDQIGQTLLFVRTKEEARRMASILQDMGLSSVALLDQSDDEVNTLLKRFEDKEIQIVVNCNRISEGVDVKGCECVILGRQYGSYAQINQVIGRAARPDSDCNVWQLANPLKKNLDAMDVVGQPEKHTLLWKEEGNWVNQDFNQL